MKCPNCGRSGSHVFPDEQKIKILMEYSKDGVHIPSFYELLTALHDEFLGKKEEPIMKITYNGFTGELVKLERSYAGKFELPVGLNETANVKWLYYLSIYDSEKQVTHSFTDVKLEDVKFLGGAVTFGG